MSTSMTLRRAIAVAAITATGATTLAAAPAADAAPNHRPKTKRTAPRTDPGFRPVRSLPGEVKAMHSPAKGQLWIATRDGDTIVLQHQDGKKWRTQRLVIPAGMRDMIDLHGVAKNDMWLTAGGQLWHYEGRRWTKVALPGGGAATTVFDVKGPAVYVGLSGDEKITGIHRLHGRTWSALGRPSDGDWFYPPLYRPTDIQVVGGKVFANWEAAQMSSSVWWSSFVLEKGAWGNKFGTFHTGAGSYYRPGAWVVPDATTQYYMTSGGHVPTTPWFTRCSKWTKSSGETTCSTGVAVGAASALPEGRMVLGGDDYQPSGRSQVQGIFAIRSANGAEKTVAGDPGDRTLAMTVEPGTDSVWAATVKGGTTTLQYWAR